MPIKINAKGVELSDKESLELNTLVNEYYEKIKRELKKEIVIDLSLKVYEKCGKNDECGKRKYSLNLKVVNSVVFKSNSYDWNLAKAVHKTFNKIMSEIEHKFHVSNQNKKL